MPRFNLSSFEKRVADLGCGEAHDIGLRLPSGQVVTMSKTQYLNAFTSAIQGEDSPDVRAILKCTHTKNGGRLVELLGMVIGN